MANKTFYNEVLTEHNLHPFHRSALENADLIMEGINPSCGDDLWIQLCIKDGRITEGAFQGDGCAISQASADMMLDLVIGKTKDEALRLADLFLRMIKEGITADELEQLGEASVLEDISHMPARVKCAVLAWRTMEAMLKQEQN